MQILAQQLQTARDHFGRGELHQAEVLCRQVLTADVRNAGGWQLLALLAERAKQLDHAAEYASRAVELAPDDPSFRTTLADIHQDRNEPRQAIAHYQAALSKYPGHSPALNNLAAVLKSLGDMHGAIAAMRRALAVDPDRSAIRSNLINMLLYDERTNGAELAAEHRRLADWWRTRYPARSTFNHSRDMDRRIRLGYVSPDLCEHAVMRFFESMLARHDRQRFEIFLYSECPIVDHVGQRLRAHGDQWRVTWLRPPETIATQIAADGVDVLIDLAGHTRHNRLDIMALRPAPVQVTFLGYPSITGLSAIDYRFTDAVLDPPGESPDPIQPSSTVAASESSILAFQAVPAGERLVRLEGGYACFRPPDEAPDAAPAPCAARGHITFGSHHPLLKLNGQVFSAWREILERAPTARLIMFRSEFFGQTAERVETLLERNGLPRERVEMRGVGKQPGDYLRSFAEIDLVLDAFPFNGHTMSCEALWMGVPVLTFRGDRPCGRLSSSVMTVLGLPEFIGDSREEYIELAVQWATKFERLAELRTQLRGLVAQWLGAERWMPHYERALERIWRDWCEEAAR